MLCMLVLRVWDLGYIRRRVFKLKLLSVQAANYLDIKGLLDVTCKTVANMIKGILCMYMSLNIWALSVHVKDLS